MSDAPSIAYACKYTPLELMRGFGVNPAPIEHEEQAPVELERYITPSICGFAKNVLSYALLPKTRALVLTTCCDAICRVADVITAHADLDFFFLLDLPHSSNDRASEKFARGLGALARELGAWCGAEFDLTRAMGAWEASAQACEQGDVVIAGAHATKSLVRAVERASGAQCVNATCSGMRMLGAPPKELAASVTNVACNACGDADANKHASDLERFLRAYAPALLSQKPCMRMVEAGEAREPDPEKHPTIYHTLRFCEYWPFDLAERAGTSASTGASASEAPMLRLETEGNASSEEQITTRLEAFFETHAPTHTHANAPAPATATDGSPKLARGIDIGSTETKAVLVDVENARILARAKRPTGANIDAVAEALLQELTVANSYAATAPLTATGYGREALSDRAKTITEITCHARGARALFKNPQTVIDIGGQDSKVITLDSDGHVATFVMNDKCAAGTGRFLDTMARALELDIDAFAAAGAHATHAAHISSMCTVFAESEVVSLVAQKTPTANIVAGISASIAQKTASLVARAHGTGPFCFTGGVSKNASVVQAIASKLGENVATNADAQFCGALGAALLGVDSF